LTHQIISKERRAWVRRSTHTVIFDSDPDFVRYSNDLSGSVMRILHFWLAEAGPDPPPIRHYLGSVRRWQSGAWASRSELVRLFRRATLAARLEGQSEPELRCNLSRYLRQYFAAEPGPDRKPTKPVNL
jgi:hypothetical protein